jgi:uncharacterized GH25 family protein
MTSCPPTPVRSSRSSLVSLPRSALALLGALVSASPASAHDHWIAPSNFRPAVGERIELALHVGHPQEFESQLRDPRRIVLFETFGPDGKALPVLGIDGKPPAGLFKAKAPGTYLVAYQSNHAFVELEPAKYAEYLRTEGLEDIQAERERRGETALPGRDSYARFDKALLSVPGGAPSSAGFERVVGMPFELVLESDPSAWKAGEELVLRLDFESQPLAGRQVKLIRLDAPHLVVLARTDEHGQAHLTPPSAGRWSAFAVHQRRATPEQALEGDWEGFWASFAFELGEGSEGPKR